MENSILLPSAIEVQETDRPNVARLVVTPCHQGYGTTVASALRRVLLSSIRGAAVEAVKIGGAQHEFSPVPGVQEDAIQIILNLKQLAIKCHSDSSVRLLLSKKGAGQVTAGDIEKNSDIEIANPELVIANITGDKAELNLEITVGNGLGYVSANEKDGKNLDLGTILTDSFYSPVKDVGYTIENTRLGDITDYEKLTLSVETNGTVSPSDAISQATAILLNHLNLIAEAVQTEK